MLGVLLGKMISGVLIITDSASGSHSLTPHSNETVPSNHQYSLCAPAVDCLDRRGE